MATYPNVTPIASTDGLPYATNVSITSNEADLNNAANAPPSTNYDPVPVIYETAIMADVVLTVNGPALLANSTYVVLQTDAGDGNWLDVAWISWAGLSGSAVFLLSGGPGGANAFQQRAAGQAPSSVNGSNQFPLGGRIRFVGKATISYPSSSSSSAAKSSLSSVTAASSSSSSSSSSSGPAPVVPGVAATIRYKLTPLR